MKSKYIELLENTLTRFQRGGYLVGDYIKFADKYKSAESYKELTPQVKAALEDVITLCKDMNLRVVNVKNKYPSAAPGNENNTNGQVFIDVGLDYGGGRFYNVVTVPADLLEVIDYGINLAPLPKALTRDNIITLKPEPVTLDKNSDTYKQTRQTAQGGKKDEDSEVTLADKNTKIPGKSAKETTAAYLKHLK